MDRRKVLGLMGVATIAGQLRAAPSARDQLIGVWNLVRQFNVAPDGEEVPVALRQRGRISWDHAGRVWVLFYNEGRKAAANPAKPTLEEYAEMNSGLMTYFGTFDLDEARQTVTHHLQAAASPALMGTDLVRRFEFSGSQLALIFPGPTQRHVILERIGDL